MLEDRAAEHGWIRLWLSARHVAVRLCQTCTQARWSCVFANDLCECAVVSPAQDSVKRSRGPPYLLPKRETGPIWFVVSLLWALFVKFG